MVKSATPDVQPPIFVVEGRHDVSVHPSIRDATSGLEGIDVQAGAYRVFDSAGRRIALRAEGVRRRWFIVDIGTVPVDAVETVPTAAGELRELLLEHLESLGGSVPAGADLATLTNIIAEKHRRS